MTYDWILKEKQIFSKYLWPILNGLWWFKIFTSTFFEAINKISGKLERRMNIQSNKYVQLKQPQDSFHFVVPKVKTSEEFVCHIKTRKGILLNLRTKNFRVLLVMEYLVMQLLCYFVLALYLFIHLSCEASVLGTKMYTVILITIQYVRF